MATVIDTRIAGIPCKVRLQYHPFSPGTRESPEEPEGYSIEEVMDRRGRRAEWLRAKMTDDDASRIVDHANELLHQPEES